MKIDPFTWSALGWLRGYLVVITISLAIGAYFQLRSSHQQRLAALKDIWTQVQTWQRQIAAWNLAVAIGMAVSTISGMPELMVVMTMVVVIRTAAFAINQVYSDYSTDITSWHFILVQLNLTAVVSGLLLVGINDAYLPF